MYKPLISAKLKWSQHFSLGGARSHALQTFTIFPSPTPVADRQKFIKRPQRNPSAAWKSRFPRSYLPKFPSVAQELEHIFLQPSVLVTPLSGDRSRTQLWWLLSCGAEEHQRCHCCCVWRMPWMLVDFPVASHHCAFTSTASNWVCNKKLEGIWPSGYLLTELGKKPLIFWGNIQNYFSHSFLLFDLSNKIGN